MATFKIPGVPANYIAQAEEVKRGQNAKIQHLLTQRKLPTTGWSEREIEQLLQYFSNMDSNNFPENCGAGEREGRIFSGMVARRCWSLTHGIGRSGDLREHQPKAIGSSILSQLTNELILDLIRQNGVRRCKDCFLAPVATGMAMALCLLTIRASRPNAKFVIWSRIDQKSCFKAIITAGYTPIILELVRFGDELRTDKHSIQDVVDHCGGPEMIAAVITCTSCFAPRVCDDVPAVAEICFQLNIPHLVNNAYGIQSTKCMSILEESGRPDKGRRVDAFVQSTDKNLMVPVGGSIIAGFDDHFIKRVSASYPGRASSSQTIDVFITLLEMGANGYKQLVNNRRENFALLKKELSRVAEAYGERVMETKNNPISLAMTLTTIGFDKDSQSVSEIGSMLFKRGVSGARVVTGKEVKKIEGFTFKGWGSHSAAMSETPYLTAAASIGMTPKDIALFIKRLDKVLAEKMKKSNKMVAPESGRKTPILAQMADSMPLGRMTLPEEVGHKTPTHELVGRKTPTPKIGQLVESQGRKTPTYYSESDSQSQKTPIQVKEIPGGQKTPTQVTNNIHQKKLTQGSAQMQSTDV